MAYQSFTIDSTKDITSPTILPSGGCVAHFRPKEDWDGSEYGFDWLRIGDSGLPADNLKYYDHYAYLMGKYYDGARNYADEPNSWTFMSDRITPVAFENDLPQFNKYICEYFDDQFLLPWMIAESNDALPLSGTSLPHHITTLILDEVNYSRITYYTPTMTLLKSKTATLNLFVKSQVDKQEPIRIEFKEKDTTKSHFILPAPIPYASSVKSYEISINCTESFSQDKYIEAYAVFIKGDGKEERKLCGRLKVLANNEIIPYHLFYIRVGYLSGTSVIKGNLIAGEIDSNSKYLNQAMMRISANATPIELTVSASTQQKIDAILHTVGGDEVFNPDLVSDDLFTLLDADFNEYLKNNMEDSNLYKEYRRVYFLGNSCYKILSDTRKAQTNGKTNGRKSTILLFDNRDKDTGAHEILHTLDLQHSFSSEGQPYSFMAQRTENLMDYSHFGDRPVNRVSTWQWQWNKMRTTARTMNNIIAMRIDASPEGKIAKEISDNLERIAKKILEDKKVKESLKKVGKASKIK